MAYGNCVAKTAGGTTTRYLVDDLNLTGYTQVVEELAGSGVQRTYTHGLQRISRNQLIGSAWIASFYGYDGGGNVRTLTDTTGTVTDTYDYDAWGNGVNTTVTTAGWAIMLTRRFLRVGRPWPLCGPRRRTGTKILSSTNFQGMRNACS